MSRADAERLRDLALTVARERFPDADEIRCNPRHECGPIVEIWNDGAARCFVLTGWEI